MNGMERVKFESAVKSKSAKNGQNNSEPELRVGALGFEPRSWVLETQMITRLHYAPEDGHQGEANRSLSATA